jgi:Tfp pilus assembly protein PilN
MKPLNNAERDRAFFWFLLLFLVTVTMIMVVVFFSIQVPMKDNEQLRRSLLTLKVERERVDSFTVVMQDAMDELSKFNLKTESPNATNQRVQYRINRLNELMKGMPNYESTVYALMVRGLADLNDAKKKLYSAQLE